MHSDYGGSFVFGVTGHQKPFLIALRFAARKPAAQGKGLFFCLPSIYEPACAQNRAHADSTCWACPGTTQSAKSSGGPPWSRAGLENSRRSEERRVGKEGRSRWGPDHQKKKR